MAGSFPPLRALLACTLLVLMLASCAERSAELGTPQDRRSIVDTQEAPDDEGRLTSRPAAGPARGAVETGLSELPLERDALVYVPTYYSHQRPAPLMVLLHGAGAGVQNQMKRLQEDAEDNGIILLAVKSEGSTWDRTSGSFGPDAQLIDEALRIVFDSYSIDERHVAIEGFSDGASYALSLGLSNGDLFTHVVAFSAGFIAPEAPRGSPKIWVSHGTEDPILPIGSTAREFVPQLKDAGYDVTYIEFAGGHLAAPRLRAQAVGWFLRN